MTPYTLVAAIRNAMKPREVDIRVHCAVRQGLSGVVVPATLWLVTCKKCGRKALYDGVVHNAATVLNNRGWVFREGPSPWMCPACAGTHPRYWQE